MNGHSKIRIKGVEYPLYFGRLAIEEMTKRTDAGFIDSETKIVTDMLYSGMLHHAVLKSEIPITYEEACHLIDDFMDEEDSSEQFQAVTKVFDESKHGGLYNEKMEGLKKKLEKMIQSTLGTTGTD